MTKVLKILGNFILAIWEILLLAIILFAFLIRTSEFQTFLAKKGAEYLSDYLETEVDIDRVDFAFLDRMYVEGLYVEDHYGDTLGYVDELFINLQVFSIFEKNFTLDEVALSNSVFKLRKYSGEESSNLQFLLDLFKSDKEKVDVDFKLLINQVSLNNHHFLFDDQHKPYKFFGVDFAHLDLTKINMSANQVLITPTNYKAKITSLSFKDHSGFILHDLTTAASFSKKGLKLGQTSILTNLSNIKMSNLQMSTNDYESYKSFVDEVPLNISLEQSSVSMYDVSFFAPALQGMDQQVEISANSSQTISEFLISDIDLKIGNNTRIKADLRLPDFRDTNELFVNQTIDEMFLSISDLNSIRLPNPSVAKYLSLPTELERLEYVSGSNLHLKGGANDLVANLGTIQTGLGNITFTTPINISGLSDIKPTQIKSSVGQKKYILFDKFQLGSFLAIKELGLINGAIGFNFEMQPKQYVKLSKVRGDFTRFYVMGYGYRNVHLENVSLNVNMRKPVTESEINGLFYVRDDNLDLVYNGRTKFGSKIDLDVAIDLQCAYLGNIHPSLENREELMAQFRLKGSGTDIETFSGSTSVDSIYYREGIEDFHISHFEATLIREQGNDELTIVSDIVNANMEGYVDLDVVWDNMLYQTAQVFPALFPDLEPVFDPKSKFSYDFDILNLNPIFEIFVPDLRIADHTQINGSYNGKQNSYDLNITSDYVRYKETEVKKLDVSQELVRSQLLALYRVDSVFQNGVLVFQQIHSTNIASNGFMDSHLIFHDRKMSRSNLEWYTTLKDSSRFDMEILPSYFTINEHKWDIREASTISYKDSLISVDNLKIERDDQLVKFDGIISSDNDESLNLEIINLDLSDITVLLAPDNKFEGRGNLTGSIKDPFNDFKFFGESEISDLIIDNREMGDIIFNANYNSNINAIGMDGELMYRKQKTFKFSGDYWLAREDDKLDVTMNFNNTDISVVNSFLDPKIVKGIKGNLNGAIKVNGTFAKLELDGVINLKNGKGKLALLGAEFSYEGEIESNEYGIFINTMPVTDEEGNTGFIVGHLFHDNFSNLMYELNFNFEDHPVYRDPMNRSKPLKIDKFLVMKTEYTQESLYYGNAYLTGNANVSGNENNMDIVVNARTQRGTWINFPMYGPTTIEEDGFIKFKSPEEIDTTLEDTGIDFTGVNLALNFDITPDARVKLIFDQNIGDQISAQGEGNLKIGLDNYGDIALNGTYTVTDGVYNFAMGPYRQNFFISPGGTVQWTGNPYSANLDIETYYKTNANLSVVMADVIESRTSDNEEIYSYLKLRGDMNKPEISFDLAAPKANEAGKAVISRIRSDKDELNRQFFSILIWKRFQPLAGQEGRAAETGGSGGAALDLVSTQINSILSQVSDDYKMNVALESDELTGESSVEFGVTKEFLDDRLIVMGSFGVGNHAQAAANQNQNNLIGDLKIEYLLNEKGTFRVNVFNQSNANSIVQNTNQGQFTQGVGINYREEFHNLRDFKAFLFLADILRKDKKLNYRDQSKYKSIPSEYLERDKEQKED